VIAKRSARASGRDGARHGALTDEKAVAPPRDDAETGATARYWIRPLAVRLEESRGALTAAHAHRHHAVPGLAAKELVGDRADHARARHAERMTDRDRAAVDVELRGIDAELIATVNDLRGERLVQLPHVDVVDLEAVTLQELRHRIHGTDAHLVRPAASDREAAEDELGTDTKGLRAVHRHHQRRARAVGQLRGVTGRH